MYKILFIVLVFLVLPMKIQFRFRSTISMADIDPQKIEQALLRVPGVKKATMYDDRLSDATFVTAVVELEDSSEITFDSLKNVLLHMAGLNVSIIDEMGDETPISTVSIEKMKVFVY